MGILSIFRKRQPKRGTATIEAVVIRSDGTVENLGVIAKGDVLINPESE